MLGSIKIVSRGEIGRALRAVTSAGGICRADVYSSRIGIGCFGGNLCAQTVPGFAVVVQFLRDVRAAGKKVIGTRMKIVQVAVVRHGDQPGIAASVLPVQPVWQGDRVASRVQLVVDDCWRDDDSD